MSLKRCLNDKGGFISAHWDGTSETELKIKDLTKATIRCIPIEGDKESGKMYFNRQPIFAKSAICKSILVIKQ